MIFPSFLINFLDRDRQWFKSSCGLDFRETSRDVSFCAHTITQQGVLVVPDTREDPRFANNPLVTGYPNIRFYAGAIIHGPRGRALGTLCVIDHKRRDFSDDDSRRLRQFADLVENEIRHTYDLETLRSSIEFSAYYDPLTQLPNRRLLTDRLAKLIELSQHEQRQLAVLLINISELHLINQSFGSETGDQLLIQVAERLRACCPLGGTTARLQTDEFILTFPSLKDKVEQVDTVVEETGSALKRPFLSDNGEHYLHVLIGGSIYPQHGSTPAALIEAAASAIRFSTRDTHGAVRFFSEAESAGIAERLAIESRLRGAVENRSFDIVYQPIVSLNSGRLASVEALLRWHDSELGDVEPDVFIPIAEQTGLILPIGQQVQECVCQQLKEWSALGDWKVPVAINVAAPELVQPGFAANLIAQLEVNEVSPALIYIETTEFSLVHDSLAVERNLQLLTAASLRVSIDDFGTGYSSLAYLGQMPVSSLKIDRSFVVGLPAHKQQVALTHTILSMARGLNLDTVAEGVETEQQLKFLQNTDCSFVQGFLLSRPIPAQQVPGLRGRSLL